MDVLEQAKHRVVVIVIDAAPMSTSSSSSSSSTAPEASCSTRLGKRKLDLVGGSENGTRMDVSVQNRGKQKKSCQGKTKERGF